MGAEGAMHRICAESLRQKDRVRRSTKDRFVRLLFFRTMLPGREDGFFIGLFHGRPRLTFSFFILSVFSFSFTLSNFKSIVQTIATTAHMAAMTHTKLYPKASFAATIMVGVIIPVIIGIVI